MFWISKIFQNKLTTIAGEDWSNDTCENKEALASEGLCISYKRVEKIRNSIVTQLRAKHIKEDIVCPPALQKGLFTTAAIDNIDNDPSSTGAKLFFHGTSISILQHRESSDLYENTNWPFKLDVTCSTDNPKPTLPCHFTDIISVKRGKPEYPSKPSLSETNSTYVDINENASEWLKALKQNGRTQRSEEVKQDVISFSAFYSTNLQKQPLKDISTMLPLIKESINSPAVVYHCLYLISKLTLKLNPNQIPIVTADQPVYAIAKQVQWNYPENFESYFLMLRPLHIEMAFLNAIGDWL